MAEIEIWRQVTDFPGYAVSSWGRVKRLTGVKGTYAGHIHKQKANRQGYLYIQLSRDGTRKYFLINRLVCTVFHGPPPTPDHQAAHIDGNKINNNESNIAWKTRLENLNDKFVHGTVRRGEEHPNSKLTEALVLKIRADTRPLMAIAKELGVVNSLISEVKSGKKWAHIPFDQDLLEARGLERDLRQQEAS